MLYKLRASTFVFVPYVVLREICGVIFRDFVSGQDKRDKMVKLVDTMDSNGISWKNMKPIERDTFEIMIALSGRDKLLDATDIMIVSHILSDPNSKFFFTVDSNMLDNTAIVYLEKDLNTNGKWHTILKIFDRFQSRQSGNTVLQVRH